MIGIAIDERSVADLANDGTVAETVPDASGATGRLGENRRFPASPCRDMMATMTHRSSDPLAQCRAAYAHEVAARYGADDPGVEAAFAKVPREAFLGPPPWRIGSGGTSSWASTSDPKSLYQDRLVALNRAKGINNGQPSLHALCISALHPTRQDHVLHVGAGTGYYTAILAELAGSVDGLRDRTRPRGASGR